MTNSNDTASSCLKKSFPEKLADWLFKTSSNWRNVRGFLLIAALTCISISFNVELGRLSAVDETSATLLPVGYALLDLASLFISGYLGIKAVSKIRKIIAFTWFTFLLALSLWAAATFTISIDTQVEYKDNYEVIKNKKEDIASLAIQVNSWTTKVVETTRYSTSYQRELNSIKDQKRQAEAELKAIEDQTPKPLMAIYDRAAPYTPFSAETLNLIIRLCWAAAMTISPLLLGLLLVTNDAKNRNNSASQDSSTREKKSLKTRINDFIRRQKVKRFIARSTAYNMKAKQQQLERQKPLKIEPHQHDIMPTTTTFKTAHAALKDSEIAALDREKIELDREIIELEKQEKINGIKGHNRHTETLSLNGLKYAQAWLEKVGEGQRITRAKLTTVSKLKSREAVSKVITALIEANQLVQRDNGHYYKVG